jgi:hypothetical protein
LIEQGNIKEDAVVSTFLKWMEKKTWLVSCDLRIKFWQHQILFLYTYTE